RASLATLGLADWESSLAAAARLFVKASSYLDTNQLWNVGPTKYQDQTVNDLQFVSAPALTHFYVSTNSATQVVAIVVEPQNSIRPGGKLATDPLTPPLACASYTTLTYIAANKVASPGFSDSIPSGYNPGSAQQTVSC